MPVFKAELLLRDKRLAWLQERGIEVNYETLSGAALQKALLGKVLEEAQELAEATTQDERVKELADVLEALTAVQKSFEISDAELESVRKQRLAELGAFNQGYYSHAVVVPEGEFANYYRAYPEKYPEREEA